MAKTKYLEPPFVRNPYNYDADHLSDITGLKCMEPTLTQQQFLEESDINFIAERFLKTGVLPQVPNMPTSGDFEGIFNFQEAMNLIKHAKDEFMALPAKIRNRFQNDPAQLIAFLEDEKNRPEAEFLGLLEKKTDRKIEQPPAPDKPGTGSPSPAPAAPPAPPEGEKPSK